jgi:hypothetical protein
MKATGPFCGHRADQFVVQFDLDVTPKATGERMQMREVGLFTPSRTARSPRRNSCISCAEGRFRMAPSELKTPRSGD